MCAGSKQVEKEKRELARQYGMVRSEVSGGEIAEELEKERRSFQLSMCEVSDSLSPSLSPLPSVHPDSQFPYVIAPVSTQKSLRLLPPSWRLPPKLLFLLRGVLSEITMIQSFTGSYLTVRHKPLLEICYTDWMWQMVGLIRRCFTFF